MPTCPEYLIAQVILAAQENGADPKKAAEEAAQAFAAGCAAYFNATDQTTKPSATA